VPKQAAAFLKKNHSRVRRSAKNICPEAGGAEISRHARECRSCVKKAWMPASVGMTGSCNANGPD
jgi:hypothetical protein